MLVLSLILFQKGRKHQRSLILALYASVEVITNGLNSLTLSAGWSFFDSYPFSHFIYKPIYCLWAPLFYFYYRSCLSANFKLRKKHWIHFLPAAILFVIFFSVLIIKGNAFIKNNLYVNNSFVFKINYVVDIVVKIQYLLYNFLMIKSLIHIERESKLQLTNLKADSLNIKWLRFMVYGYAIGCLGGIAVFLTEIIYKTYPSTLNIISISYFFLFFFGIFYQTITQKSFEKDLKSKPISEPDEEMTNLMQLIEDKIINKKMFLNHELSLLQIANELNEKERNISQAINTLKKQNVNEYINKQRIDFACNLLSENPEKPIFEIMYESGFSTKAAFNLSFKKITGKTPTQYREEFTDSQKYK